MSLYEVFSRGPLKKGGPEATASFTSPNIHHWLWLVCGLRKYALLAIVICVLVVIESGLEILAGDPSNSVSLC